MACLSSKGHGKNNMDEDDDAEDEEDDIDDENNNKDMGDNDSNIDMPHLAMMTMICAAEMNLQPAG